jgi:hypothetical protein
MNKSTSRVVVAAVFAMAMMSGVATAQVPGDGIPDVYYFPTDGEVMTSQGMISRPAGDLTLDTDGADIVAFFVGGADVSTSGCNLCDGNNLPGTDALAGTSAWTVGFSAGSVQYIRTNPLSGTGFRGVVGTGFVDGTDTVQDWPADQPPFLDFSDIGVGLANYGPGATFDKVFDGGAADVQWANDAGGGGFVNVTTVTTIPEPASFSLLGLAGLALLGLRRR